MIPVQAPTLASAAPHGGVRWSVPSHAVFHASLSHGVKVHHFCFYPLPSLNFLRFTLCPFHGI